jgi:hypothetical protein
MVLGNCFYLLPGAVAVCNWGLSRCVRELSPLAFGSCRHVYSGAVATCIWELSARVFGSCRHVYSGAVATCIRELSALVICSGVADSRILEQPVSNVERGTFHN